MGRRGVETADPAVVSGDPIGTIQAAVWHRFRTEVDPDLNCRAETRVALLERVRGGVNLADHRPRHVVPGLGVVVGRDSPEEVFERVPGSVANGTDDANGVVLGGVDRRDRLGQAHVPERHLQNQLGIRPAGHPRVAEGLKVATASRLEALRYRD